MNMKNKNKFTLKNLSQVTEDKLLLFGGEHVNAA